MPKLSAMFVRISLIYLWLGITFGALLLANKGIPLAPWVWMLLPAHMEILLVGWLVQFAMGIIYWILPRFSHGSPRGNVHWSIASMILLNAGIIVTIVPNPFPSQLLMISGRIFETLGVIAFGVGNWKRVKPSGV